MWVGLEVGGTVALLPVMVGPMVGVGLFGGFWTGGAFFGPFGRDFGW
jgi:hypothetical protein